MGLTHVDVVVTGAAGKSARVRLLVDSGAVYSLLPSKTWKAIGLRPKRTMTFDLADGTQVERRVSECHFALREGEAHSPVILGERADQGLLGVVTLENLGLVLNPFSRRLQPLRGMLASSRRR